MYTAQHVINNLVRQVLTIAGGEATLTAGQEWTPCMDVQEEEEEVYYEDGGERSSQSSDTRAAGKYISLLLLVCCWIP